MPSSLSKLLVGSLAAQASGLVLPATIHSQVAARAGTLTMQDNIKFDNDMSGWKPNNPGAGGGHTLGGEYEATDTPDFAPEAGSEQEKMAAGISYTDGIMGSREPTHLHPHT